MVSLFFYKVTAIDKHQMFTKWIEEIDLSKTYGDDR